MTSAKELRSAGSLQSAVDAAQHAARLAYRHLAKGQETSGCNRHNRTLFSIGARGLTSALSGRQYAPRSGTQLLRIRYEQPVSPLRLKQAEMTMDSEWTALINRRPTSANRDDQGSATELPKFARSSPFETMGIDQKARAVPRLQVEAKNHAWKHGSLQPPKWWFQASWISFKWAVTTACACRSCVAERPVWLARTTCGVSQNFASPSACATCT